MRIRGQTFKVLIGGLALGAALLTSATCAIFVVSPEGCPSKNAPCIELTVRSTRPFTITFRGQNYSDSGGGKDFSYRVERLPLGQNEVTGSTSADSISIGLAGFGRISNGGISPESLQSVEGPGASVQRIASACRVTYAPTAGTSLPYTLRIRFDVGLSTPSC
jgi:hypothetical protein